MQKLQLSIPEPCHENWAQMTPNEKGRFCAACQKNVYDFTKATDREIINAYEKDQKLCGRFLKTQLDRELIIPKERKSVWLASLFFGMIALFDTKATAQEKAKTEQTDIKNQDSGKTETEVVLKRGEKILTGIVSDPYGPIPGVNVIVQGTTRGTHTKLDGSYSIRVKEGEKLIYSFMGMNDVVKTVGASNVINTTLQDNNVFLGEIIFSKSDSPKKSVYYGRFPRSVETWLE
ncbi:carboxypeptidase-like regulatory domain-containing protein [Flavobacterium sp. GCM10027622]|uniref:carboxypeptidase-like regulatory domain-containing protein n=1 Tax=unclassified Flavobacterium TaxID=196869 RepID=UPI003608E02D